MDLTGPRGFGSFVTTPVRVVLAVAAIGAALVVAGVAVLAGLGWSLVASGVLLLVGSALALHDDGRAGT